MQEFKNAVSVLIVVSLMILQNRSYTAIALHIVVVTGQKCSLLDLKNLSNVAILLRNSHIWNPWLHLCMKSSTQLHKHCVRNIGVEKKLPDQ